MARRHRRLFPISINQTTDCAKFCDPPCSFNCYSYPYYYYTSPPPPAADPPPYLPVVDDESHQNNHVSLYLIIFASIFAGLFLLAAYFVINKTYSLFCCNNQGHSPSPSVHDNTNEEFLDENQVDHPVWYIATVGLQQSIINSITICRYKKGEGLVEGTECSVCLGGFHEDETLRLLPKCSHAFHISCIDTWLRSHTNCPLCRATIVSNNGNTEVYMPALPSVNLESNNSRGNEESEIESGNNGNNTVEIVTGISENRGGSRQEGEPQETSDEMNFKEQVRDNVNHFVTVSDDSTDSHQTKDAEIELMKNTTSNDSSSFTDSHVKGPVQCCSTEQNGECSSLFTTVSHSPFEKYLHTCPVSMKRSSSCGGRITYQER